MIARRGVELVIAGRDSSACSPPRGSYPRHVELFGWLQGEVQEFLPHQILVAAWGDFAALEHEVRRGLAACRACAVVRARAAARSTSSSATPTALGARRPRAAVARRGGSRAAAAALQLPAARRDRPMRSLLVHGVRDKLQRLRQPVHLPRLAHARAELHAQPRLRRARALVALPVDLAWRRVAALQLDDLPAARRRRAARRSRAQLARARDPERGCRAAAPTATSPRARDQPVHGQEPPEAHLPQDRRHQPHAGRRALSTMR